MPRRVFLVLSALILSSLVATAAAADRNVEIVNATSTTIKMFFASNVDAKKWQEDILGDDVLRPGESVNVNIDDGTTHCNFDFRAIFVDGQDTTKHDVNVCKVGRFTFND